jgi:hypothetical protein
MLGSRSVQSLPRPLSRLGRFARRGLNVLRLAGPLLLVAVAAWERVRQGARDLVAGGSSGVGRLAGGSGRRAAEAWRERPAARRARLRARAREPLPNLWEVYPEARRALGHDVGLRSVPVDEIVGTAVAGAAQRGGDFLPLPDFRSRNWQGRWARIRRATDRLEILPPVDLVRYGDGYWVEDGHNRVAAALYNGQQDIDAVVRELRMPGYVDDDTDTVATLAPIAAVGGELRQAGAGRFSSEAATERAGTSLDGGGTRHVHEPAAPGGTTDPPEAESGS